MDKLTVCFYCADQNTHRDRSRGITRYTHELLSHLRDTKKLRLLGVTSKSSFAIPDGIEQTTLPFKTDHLIGRLAADHLHPIMVPRDTARIWHYPKGFLPIGIQIKGKKVGTVADVMLQHDADCHPESRSRLAFSYWLGMLKHSIQSLDLILTISEFSKQAILEFCDRHRLKCPPIVVTWMGVRISQSEETVKGDYVLHLASNLPYKGTRWLLEQWSALSKTSRDLPVLKLVGNLDAQAMSSFSTMTNVSLIPPPPRTELEKLIARSRALLLPSEIEGFGIPAVEGYLLGTPVAYARATALEEILGPDTPGGFCRDLESFRSALDQVLNMDRFEVERKGEALKLRYNWDDCVGRTIDAYRSVLSQEAARNE